MPFVVLNSGEEVLFVTTYAGEEILIDALDVPTPPESIFRDNPYTKGNKLYKNYRKMQIARYHRATYRAIRISKDIAEFNSHIKDAELHIKDESAWSEHLSNRGIRPNEIKRDPWRPKLADDQKVNNPRIKRSDKMKKLLSEKGISVNTEGELFLDGNSVPYEGFIFLPNGRIKHEESNIGSYTISTYQFIEDYC